MTKETNWTQRKEELSNDLKALNAQSQKAEEEGSLALAAGDTKSADDCFNRCDGIVREMKRIESAISACTAHIRKRGQGSPRRRCWRVENEIKMRRADG
jgi:hypothetical protein